MSHPAGYVRVSTEEQAREGFSIDAQKRILQAYALVKSLGDIVVYTDDGYSAKNLNRPAMQRLIGDCKNGTVSAVIVWRLDRFSRSLRDTVDILDDVLMPRKIDFVSATENIDTSTPSGRLMLNILASFAQSEREATSERVQMVAADLARQCKHMGGVAPFGYKVVDEHYQIDEANAVVVRELFRMFIERQGYNAMLAYLNDNGIRTMRGNAFDKNTLYGLLGNEKYNGTFVFNRRAAAGRDGKRNDHKNKDESEIIRVPNGMPAIIDQETWEEAKAMREQNRTRAASYRTDNSVYLLSGITFCGVCGRPMSGDSCGKDRNGTNQHYYVCRDKCVPSVRKERLEDHVMEAIKSYLDEADTIREAANIANRMAIEVEEEDAASAPAIRKRIKENEKEYTAALNLIQTEGADAPVSAMADLKRLRDEKTELLSDLANMPKTHVYIDAEMMIDNLRAAWEAREKERPLDEQKTLIQRAVKRVVVNADDINVSLSKGTSGGGEGSRTSRHKVKPLYFPRFSLTCFASHFASHQRKRLRARRSNRAPRAWCAGIRASIYRAWRAQYVPLRTGLER
ncbi:hypothetical protein AGMMS49992_27030 [Clostridia bacterium]|nr:hypothetical protein AGMMS49992_27030 [Clostridia bacterium]